MGVAFAGAIAASGGGIGGRCGFARRLVTAEAVAGARDNGRQSFQEVRIGSGRSNGSIDALLFLDNVCPSWLGASRKLGGESGRLGSLQRMERRSLSGDGGRHDELKEEAERVTLTSS